MTDKEDKRLIDSRIEWIPFALIVGGLILARTGIDNYVVIMNLGFLIHGTLGLVQSIKLKYHKGFSIRYFKIAGQIMIMLLAVDNFFRPESFLALLLLVVLDKVILVPSRLETAKR